MNAVIYLAQTMLGAASNGIESEAYPFTQNIAQAFLPWTTIGADHHQINSRIILE